MVVKNECEFVGPPTCGQSQSFSINHAAVHGSQINEWSVRDGNRSVAKHLINDLVLAHFVDGVGPQLII